MTLLIALKFSQENGHKRGEGQANGSLAAIYSMKGNDDLALAYYKKTARIFDELGNELFLAIARYNIGSILSEDGQYEDALIYYEKAHEYYLKYDLGNHLVSTYSGLGDLYLKTNRNLDEILEALNNAERLARIENDTLALVGTLNLKGNAFVKKNKKLTFAISNFEEAINLIKIAQPNNQFNLAYSYYSMGEAQFMLGNYAKALLYNDTALAKYKSFSYPIGLKKTYENRKDILEKMGSFKEGFEAFKMLKFYSDSLYSQERSKQLSRMKTEYETERKEAEILSLSQQASIQASEIRQKNLAIVIGLITVILILLATYFIYRQHRLKSQQFQTELEQRFLRSQLNPHFISNALMAVQNFMLKNQSEKAAHYLAKFSKLMREILENSRQEFILVEDEIQMLTNYMEIHKMRMNDAFEYKIIVDENIDPETDSIPPMFVQPFIENAIEHGIIKAQGIGLIELNFVKIGDYISIEVIDNGGGLVQNHPEVSDHTSLSTTIIKERMALFNKSLKHKIQLVLEDIKNDLGEIRGTKVQLKVPYRYL